MAIVYWCPDCDEALDTCVHRDDPAFHRGEPCTHPLMYLDSEEGVRCAWCAEEVR